MMTDRWCLIAGAVWLVMSGGDSSALAAEPVFQFRDVAQQFGLRPDVEHIAGHAAAWGDVDGDGFPDLYVGTFHKPDTKANMLFRSSSNRFRIDNQKPLAVSGRAGGAVFADLDNDGDLDLYLSNLGGGRQGFQSTDSRLFQNDGAGQFSDVSNDSGACPVGFRGRSVCVLDYDGDGRLDLLLGEGIFYGSPKHSRLMRNLGDFRFEDVTESVGLPAVPGLGVAAADVNNDGWPDLFFAASMGGNRLFLNDHGRFREAKSSVLFEWKSARGDNMVTGIAMGDVNNDGLTDIVIGPHFERPWLEPIPIRLFLHRGVTDREPRFEEVTEAAGLVPLPMKAPHVEIQDFDNDGRPDILTSIVTFSEESVHPVIFRNLGDGKSSLRFRQEAMSQIEFPTDEDRATKRTGPFFDKMIADCKILYVAPAPTADFNRDGRLDIFLASWWPEAPSLLLKNETETGNWIQIVVRGTERVNRMGIGSRVRLYEPGRLGDPKALVGSGEIRVGYGYASGQEAIAHFGLGNRNECDVEILLPHGNGRLTRNHVEANQRVLFRERSTD